MIPDLIIKIGETRLIAITPMDIVGVPAGVTTGSVKYTSSKKAVFTITKDPKKEFFATLKAVGSGTATGKVTVKNTIGGTVTKSFTVSVSQGETVDLKIEFTKPE